MPEGTLNQPSDVLETPSPTATEHKLGVRVCRNLRDLQDLQPAWEDLLLACPTASIFSTWAWLVSWWRSFGDAQKLFVLAFYDANSRLVGLAPLAVAEKRVAGLTLRVLRLMGDGSGDSDNLELLARSGSEPEIMESFFDFIEKQMPEWDICELNTLPAQSLSGKHVILQLAERHWHHVIVRRPCSAVALPESWEAYQALLSSKERGKLNYLSRRLQRKYKVRAYKCTQISELGRCLEHLYRLHQKRWESRGQSGSFCSGARRTFYTDLSQLLLDRGQLEFWLLELDGKTVAALFGFRHLDTVYALQEGFDPSYQAESVGYVLRGYMLRRLIDAGVRRYDFLAGQSPSKTRWGAAVGYYLDVRFARPNSLGSISLRASQGGDDTKEWLREHLPESVWTLLHRFNIVLRGQSTHCP